MNVDALSAVEGYLRERHAQLPEISDSLVPVPPLKISPQLDVTEAEDFLSGLKEGLFTIDEDGYAQRSSVSNWQVAGFQPTWPATKT